MKLKDDKGNMDILSEKKSLKPVSDLYQRRLWYLFLAVTFGIFALDQLTKGHIQYHFGLYESRAVIPGFFSLTYITNTGVAFGLMSGEPDTWKRLFFLSVTLLAIGFIFYLFGHFRSKGRGAVIALGMILGGAIGNMVDRVRLGKVIDFLDFYIGGCHWPAFNVADAAITCGVLYLALALYRQQG
ncbi:MAG: signal peptidase II [Deltaproteobacteria bacterium]|nr:signal peptidase II [Deltaproteobacteria bacterium]